MTRAMAPAARHVEDCTAAVMRAATVLLGATTETAWDADSREAAGDGAVRLRRAAEYLSTVAAQIELALNDRS